MPKRFVRKAALAIVVTGVALYACVDPPPKIAAIPSGGLALKLYVFGASAQDARRAFESAKQNNQGLSIVNEGGDGEILLGLENDSPKCVPPTALCSYRIAFRVKSYRGDVLHVGTANVSASSDRCADLCARALNNVVVKVVEAAAVALRGGATSAEDASAESDASADAEGAADAAGAPPPPPAPPSPRGKRTPPKKPEVVAPKPPPLLCGVAAGPRLPSEEAERRTAQVEVLKRLNVIDQDEYDCLRKAYLDRL